MWPLSHFLRQRGGSLQVFGGLSIGLLLAGLVLRLIFAQAGFDIEDNTPFIWGWVCASATLAGLLGAAWARRMPVWELVFANLLVLELATLLALFVSADEGLAAPPLRILLVAPAALGLCAYFGASLGYLLWGSGDTDLRLGYESLIGRRFLLSKASAVLSTVTTISVIGVALGVWLVLVSLGILAGFESDLQRKIIGANAHVVLQRDDLTPVQLTPESVERVARTPGVVAAAPFIEGEVAIASSSNYTGAQLFGIDPSGSPEVLAVLKQLQQGALEPLLDEMNGGTLHAAAEAGATAEFAAPAALANIVIGVEMAKGLNVKVGDRVRLISPLLEVLTPIGAAPKSLGFRVAAIFASKMYEYDARYAYVSLPAARRFFELDAADVTGLQLRCTDPERTERIGTAAAQALGHSELRALDWKRRNQTLFSALKLERVVAFVVLVFIILVASFSIVNTLTMSVIEKRKEIAILKTMGARDIGIMKLFLVQGLVVGSSGTLIGATCAVTTMKLLERFGFWIPGEVYYIDSLPVKMDAADVVLVVLAALLIVWDFAVFPALRGSQIQPVEGLRDG
jgi:lipoprotein-releasing system permease protein